MLLIFLGVINMSIHKRIENRLKRFPGYLMMTVEKRQNMLNELVKMASVETNVKESEFSQKLRVIK